jgi:predicted transposase YbfD/YdcC
MAQAVRARSSLIDHFSALEDPRQSWKVLYPLEEILLLVLCAVLSGADDFVEIADWGRLRLGFLRRLLAYERGIPSHDAINDLINALEPSLFETCFRAWVEDLRGQDPEIIALDGKTSRRSGDKRRGRAPLHCVSAWASRQRLVLGQRAVAPGSNEIEAIPPLLSSLALGGALVTIDAIGCQKAIARQITEAGGDYLLAVKANQPALLEEIELLFKEPPEDLAMDRHETTDGDHGRIEIRRHAVITDLEGLEAPRRWPALKALAKVEAQVERDGKTTRSTRYYIASTPLDARFLARAVRAHWTIENQLHWILDVVFHDDLARLRTQNGPANMAIVRHMAVNIIRAAKDKASQKVRRKKAAWSTDYLYDLIKPNT